MTPLLHTKEVERMLGFASGTLGVLRHKRSANQPPYIQLGRSVRYDPAAVQDWLASRTVHPGAGRTQPNKLSVVR
jgi:predicted DNA-binding transcriptional regulator AlpA